MKNGLQRAAVLNGFQLKWIAVICMAADHTGRILFPEQEFLIRIGRIAFPVFAFLLTEGFFHTSDVRRYLLRLGLFAVISEIPFDLAFHRTFWYPQGQNVFFTLLISMLLLCFLERSREWTERILMIFIAMWLAEAMSTDYGFRGVLLVLIFYICRQRRLAGLVAGGLWNFLWHAPVQYFGAAAMFLLGVYNGEKGRSMKYFFYVFYPAHLLLLYMIQRLAVQ